MGTQEIIISDPKRNAVDSTIFRPIPTGNAVGFLEGTVQALNELLERTEFFRHFIVICKTDDLGDEDVPILFELKLLGSKWIGTITIRDKFQALPGNSLNLSNAIRMVRMQGPTSLEVET